MQTKLTKQFVKQQLGFDTDAALARFFGIGRWAVTQWSDEKPIPMQRQWELMVRRPDLFAPPKPKKKRLAKLA